MKFYTLGHAANYEAALRAGRVWKIKGGWALPLDIAIEYKERLESDTEFADMVGLNIGTYDIYELPSCTIDIVHDEVLTNKTIIGKKVSNEDQKVHGWL